MNVYKKVKIKTFIFDLVFELIMLAGILATAFLYNKLIETSVFYACWLLFRFSYPKVYHFKHYDRAILNVLGCIVTSSVIFYFSISRVLPVYESIFASVVLSMLINLALYKIQDYIDLKNKAVNDIYNLNEEQLRNYAKGKGLSETIIDTLVLRVIHNYRWVDIQKELNYSKDGIRYHKEQISKKLNIRL